MKPWKQNQKREGSEALIQLHFEKTLEKKRGIDLQKKELHKLFEFFFIFLSLVFMSFSHHLQCRHCWSPLPSSPSPTSSSRCHSLTLRCINAFKYQKRCHKLTLLKDCNGTIADDQHLEIQYQEPAESYFGKFKRNWALHFGFLIIIYAFMVSSCHSPLLLTAMYGNCFCCFVICLI